MEGLKNMDTTKMNIYKKLQKCRVEFNDLKIKKSGYNKFAKFSYYELEDILPVITTMFNRDALCDMFSRDIDNATLTIVNIDNPEEQVIFSTNTADDVGQIKNPIQKLGSTTTYMKRYLYMAALNISENDIVDGLDNTKDISEKPKTRQQAENKKNNISVSTPTIEPMATSAQGKKIFATVKQLEWSEKKRKEFMMNEYKIYSSNELTKRDAMDWINKLEIIVQEREEGNYE